MLKDSEKNIIICLAFSIMFFGFFVLHQNNKIGIEKEIKHNSLKTDYAKVIITWNPPNNAPTISAGPAESSASCTSTPTNVGSSVTFQATAIDGDGDNYYLAICKTNAIADNESGAPTCTGGSWCVSGSTASASQASCSTTTLAAWNTSNDWYAFACDYHTTDSKCSSMSQGTGDSGSPFEVNHAPYLFNGIVEAQSPVDPGASPYFNAYYLYDSDGDMFDVFFCKTQSATASGCSAGTFCSDLDSGGSYRSCFGSSSIPSVNQEYFYTYIFDDHGLGWAENGTSGYMVINNIWSTESNVSLNSGSDITLDAEGDNGSTTIYVTADITDNNGCQEVAGVKAWVYPNASSSECLVQNNNNCYISTCATSSACNSGITQQYTCAINFKYHADPTDTGTIRADDKWMAQVHSWDAEGSSNRDAGDATSSKVELNSYISLNVDSTINYGQLAIGEMASTTALTTTTNVYSTGNVGIDVLLSGTNMTGAGTIAVGQQRYATSGVQYSSAYQLTTSPTELELNCRKPTTTSALPSKTIFWGLQIPSGASAGSHSGTNTFTATKAETGDW